MILSREQFEHVKAAQGGLRDYLTAMIFRAYAGESSPAADRRVMVVGFELFDDFRAELMDNCTATECREIMDPPERPPITLARRGDCFLFRGWWVYKTFTAPYVAVLI